MLRNARSLGLLLLSTALWLPCLHLLSAVGPAAREARAATLPARQPAASPSPHMRGVNPEWDFMKRTYAVLALANRALARPADRARDLAAIDAIVDRTLAEADERGDMHFMLPYAKRAPFVDPEGRSLFIDGEILAM